MLKNEMFSDLGYQNETERDYALRFHADQYVSEGYFLHSHRTLELYGVARGRVATTISNETQIMTEGQIAVIDSMEYHKYEADGRAEVFFIQIGFKYLKDFRTLYPRMRMPHWLMDEEYNARIYAKIKDVFGKKASDLSELRKIEITSGIFADIVEHYGVVEKKINETDDYNITEEIIEYVYDHYAEDISLELLAKIFYISPKSLGKKMHKRLHVDFRVFVNDIRVQKVVEMLENPVYKKKSIEELAELCGFKNMGTFYRSYERNFKFLKLDQ